MLDANKLILIWHVTEQGAPVGMDSFQAEEKLEALGTEYSGQQILHALIHRELIEEGEPGKYQLTREGVRVRMKYPDAVSSQPISDVKSGHEWDRFRKILSYYIDCIHSQEQPQEYLLTRDLNRTFIVPELPVQWLTAPGVEPEFSMGISEEQRAAMQRIVALNNDTEEIYIGYPVSACQTQADHETCYTPVGLIPVDILDFQQTTVKIRIRTSEAELNLPWLELNYPPEERSNLLSIILQLHANDKYSGVIDLLNALPLLERNNIKFDPCHYNRELLPDDGACSQSLFNTPVLFMGQPLHYSKTLKKELKYIRDRVPDDVLDTTALAYIFREPVLENRISEKNFMPLPFIEANPEQMSAVGAALNMPSVKITGPPGTGKSQVAVNIIANQIFNGRTVLFSSRNHKAVEVIYNRSQQVLSEPGLTLVNFCTKEKPNPWYSQNLDLLVAEAALRDYTLNDDQLFQIETDVERWRDIERKHSPRSHILSEYEVLRRKIAGIQRKMRMLMNSEKFSDLSLRDYRLLSLHISNLARPALFGENDFMSWMQWKMSGRRKDSRAREFLKANYPELDFSDLDELKKYFRQYTHLYSIYRELMTQWKRVEEAARALPSMEGAEEKLGEVFSKMSSSLHDALVICRGRKIGELNNNPELVTRLKDIMSYVKSSQSPYYFQRLEVEEAIKAENGFKMFAHYYPGWAVSLLSLTNASPCIPHLFDSVIIDEASQCDPACVIPALFRGKSVVFVGDSNQFPPVITLKQMRNDYLKRRNGITSIADQHFDFLNTSAFGLSSVTPILLKEHFRCSDEIAGYFNEVFYGNELHIRTDKERLNLPECLGLKHAVEWISIANSNADEFKAVEEILKTLLKNEYTGTVGVITPFKQYADFLRRRLYHLTSQWPDNEQNAKVLIDTANGFQGDERDVIIFVLGYNDSLTKGRFWYIEAPENRYIYNVAVSRAKACLLIVGDRERCRASSIRVLNKLAQLPLPVREQANPDLFDSPWEKKLYLALKEAGMETQPQYPLLGRHLDLALISGDQKIDIEVDGIHFHLDEDGSRKMDDFYRDLQVRSQGWQVKRFWVYELRDDMPGCVEQIRKMIKTVAEKQD